MTTIKINEQTKTGKAFMDMVKTFFNNVEGIEVIETKSTEIKEESPYNPKFVKMVLKAEKRGDYKEIDPKDVWGSLGLK